MVLVAAITSTELTSPFSRLRSPDNSVTPACTRVLAWPLVYEYLFICKLLCLSFSILYLFIVSSITCTYNIFCERQYSLLTCLPFFSPVIGCLLVAPILSHCLYSHDIKTCLFHIVLRDGVNSSFILGGGI